jgi:hypothetical protein
MTADTPARARDVAMLRISRRKKELKRENGREKRFRVPM